MKTIADRVKELREQRGWSQSELARQVSAVYRDGKIKPQSVQQLEEGTVKRPKYLLELAKVLGTTPEYLLTGRIPRPISVSSLSLGISDGSFEAGPDLRGRHPLISWVQAGKWSQIMDNFHPGDAEDWVPCPVSCSPSTFVLRVRGGSMEPEFREGDLIFVDPEAPVENGKYVVVRLDDREEATFKRLVIEGDEKYLEAVNPAWPERIIRVDENATICGVVVFSGKYR